MKQIKEEEKLRSKKQCDKLVHEKRQDALFQRATKEKEKLSMLHLIRSSDELCDALSEINSEDISAKKKTEKKKRSD